MFAGCRARAAALLLDSHRPLRRRLSHPAIPPLTSSSPSSSSSRAAFSVSASTRAKTNSSVDADEVNHFNALASTWWDPHGPSRLLHLMNPLRHSFISSCLASQPDATGSNRGLHYLDVGCGGGIFAESAARLPHTASVTGIDPSADVLNVAEAHARKDPLFSLSIGSGQAPRRRLRYLNAGIEDLALSDSEQTSPDNARPPEGGYDIVTLFEVLEHVSHPSSFLGSLLPHVRPGGWLVLSTIARTWTSWVTTKVVAEDLLRVVPRGTHDWKKYVNEGEIRHWFAERQGKGQGRWTNARAMGVIYVPGAGWREVRGAEEWGNYFFGVRRAPE